MSLKGIITEMLDKSAFEKYMSIMESLLPVDNVVGANLSEDVHKIATNYAVPHQFERRIGRVAIINRVRNGSLQMNKRVDVMGKGFKLMPNGQVIRMSIKEVINRKRAAKRASRKRQMEMASIVRKRMLSLRRRNSELGYFK